MSDEVVIITPELSPATGGVGDYTLRLLETWPSAANVKVLSAQGDLKGASSPPYRVERLGPDSSLILKQLPESGGKVLVQYSAYGFDRLGYPRKLVHALLDWKAKTHGRLVIMFHEIWAFWPVMNKNFFVQLLHRRAIKRLLECADAVFTSTQSQSGHLNALLPRVSIHVLPVGSNIRRNEHVDLARTPGCAVIFGLQRGRIRALKRMEGNLSSLAAAGHITKIISVGAGGDLSRADEERAVLTGLKLKEGFEQCGPRPEAEISNLLLTSALGIFAQDELSVTKSGTFMAYAAHELNVLADFAEASKPEPICWLVAPRELLAGISESELRGRAQHLLTWQGQVSSWNRITKAFVEALDPNATRPSPAGAANH